jgi:hypothetical protein
MYEFEMWIWCQPDVNGLRGVEFAIDYPDGVIPAAPEINPGFMTPWIGSLETGVATVANDCAEGWIWVFRQTIYVTSPGEMAIRLIGYIGNPQYDVPIYTACEEELGYPIHTFNILTDLYINYSPDMEECGCLAAEDASWGAIKALVGE